MASADGDGEEGPEAAAPDSVQQQHSLLSTVSPLEGSIGESAAPTGDCRSEYSLSWEDNASNCAICDARLSKRLLAPRHHCRVCGRNVCGACSPNLVQLAGQSGPRRACVDCISDVERVADAKLRIAGVALRLRGLSSAGDSNGGLDCRGASLEQAVRLCEDSVESVEGERAKFALSLTRLEDLERKLDSARASVIRLGIRIYGSRKLTAPAGLQSASLDKAVQICEEALGSPEMPRRQNIPTYFDSREARQPLADARSRDDDPSTPAGSGIASEHGRGGCCAASPLRCALMVAAFILAAGLLAVGLVVVLDLVAPRLLQPSLDAAPAPSPAAVLELSELLHGRPRLRMQLASSPWASGPS